MTPEYVNYGCQWRHTHDEDIVFKALNRGRYTEISDPDGIVGHGICPPCAEVQNRKMEARRQRLTEDRQRA